MIGGVLTSYTNYFGWLLIPLQIVVPISAVIDLIILIFSFSGWYFHLNILDLKLQSRIDHVRFFRLNHVLRIR